MSESKLKKIVSRVFFDPRKTKLFVFCAVIVIVFLFVSVPSSEVSETGVLSRDGSSWILTNTNHASFVLVLKNSSLNESVFLEFQNCNVSVTGFLQNGNTIFVNDIKKSNH